jgi:hypothetical protein
MIYKEKRFIYLTDMDSLEHEAYVYSTLMRAFWLHPNMADSIAGTSA